MFKHKLVRQLTLLLVIKLIAVFTIKNMYFDQPVIPQAEQAEEQITEHFFSTNQLLLSKEHE